MGRALFFTILGTMIFLIYTYTVYRIGLIRGRHKDRGPRNQHKLLRDANRVMHQVTTVSNLDGNFTILNDRDRTAIERWLSTYERENP